jgi:Zn-dependent peptidase ImmA (M78 family)
MQIMKLDKNVKDFLNTILKDVELKGYELQLDDLCKTLGLSIFGTIFTEDNISGAIYREKNTDKFKIYVNRNHSLTRRRFTIAHEIGHYISALCGSHSENQLFNTNQGFADHSISFLEDGVFSEAETEANEIAAQILMPKNYIDDFINSGFSIEDMAELFFVSQAAMSIRLYNLGIRFL